MRAYLEQMKEGQEGTDDWPVMIAALGPKMLELSGQLCAGALPYNVTPEHTAMARKLAGPDATLAVEQKVCLQKDRATALGWAKRELGRYMQLPNYRNNWLNLGFTEEELSDGGNERFLSAMVVHGDEKAIADCVAAHRAAGANHVSIQPVTEEGDVAGAKRMLEALADI